MNIDDTIKQLKKKYPGKAVFADTECGAAEVIAEIEPTTDHPEYSHAVAVAGTSRAHYHTELVETYTPITGDLTVYVDNEKHIVRQGDSITINPGQVHWAEGDAVWFDVLSKPGWTPDDHIHTENS